MRKESRIEVLNKKYSKDELKSLVKEFVVPLIKPGSIFLLNGSLGVGKTHLMKTIGEIVWGIKDINSPTYAYVNVFSVEDIDVCHFDLYRVDGFDYLQALGLYDYIANPRSICFIEWPALVMQELGSLLGNRDIYEVRLSFTDEEGDPELSSKRTIKLCKILAS